MDSVIDKQLNETAEKLAQTMRLKEEAEAFARTAETFNANFAELRAMAEAGKFNFSLSAETKAELSGKISDVMQAAFAQAVLECKAAGEEMATKIRETGEGMVRELNRMGDDMCKSTIEKQWQLEGREDTMTSVKRYLTYGMCIGGFLFGFWAATIVGKHVGIVIFWIFIGAIVLDAAVRCIEIIQKNK